jgi:hypothetical protein
MVYSLMVFSAPLGMMAAPIVNKKHAAHVVLTARFSAPVGPPPRRR